MTRISRVTPALLFCLCLPVHSADQGAVVFSDNFSQLHPGWGDGEELSVSGNKLIVQVQPNATYHRFYEQSSFDLTNADISIAVRQLEGGNDQSAGLAFWAIDDENYYVALLEPDGVFYVARKTGGLWINPVPVQSRSEIKQGTGETNELRVVTSGELVTVYINGQRTARFRGFPPAGKSKIGIRAESGDAACQWAFSDLKVGKAPAVTNVHRPHDAGLLYADDFATLDPAWHHDVGLSVSGNKLILKPDTDKSIGFLYSGCLFGDADIRLKITESAGGVTSPGGLLFWAADIDNLYAAFVEADGGFYIGRKIDGEWTTLVPMKPRSEVRKGVGQVNELRVVTVQESATFYVNGHEVARIDGYKHPAQSKIGLQVESDELAYTWAISNLLVRKPSP